MQAVDTNILVYAEMTVSPFCEASRRILRNLGEPARSWAIPWPCIYEFLKVVTHPRIYRPPMDPGVALDDLKVLLASPSLILLQETSRHAELMDELIRSSGVTGNLIHDAHIAALCLEHGVNEIFTGDRDFLRFPGLKITNPFAART